MNRLRCRTQWRGHGARLACRGDSDSDRQRVFRVILTRNYISAMSRGYSTLPTGGRLRARTASGIRHIITSIQS